MTLDFANIFIQNTFDSDISIVLTLHVDYLEEIGRKLIKKGTLNGWISTKVSSKCKYDVWYRKMNV